MLKSALDRIALLTLVSGGHVSACATAGITCPAITVADSSNATWPASAVGASVAGTCLPGYTGTPTRPCVGTTTQPGTWSAATTGCTRTVSHCTLQMRRSCRALNKHGGRGGGEATAVICAAADYSGNVAIQASFPNTLAGTSAVGTCAAGLFGLPQLQCQLNGSWNTTAVLNPCSCTLEACLTAR